MKVVRKQDRCAIAYVKGSVNEESLIPFTKKLDSLEVTRHYGNKKPGRAFWCIKDGITAAELPQAQYGTRPDVACSYLMKGISC